MRWTVAAAIAGLAGALSAAGFAIAQGSWTTVTKDDLQICTPIFAEVQRIEHAYFQSRIAALCTDAGSEGCVSARDRLSDSQAQAPLDWFFAGNDECPESADYPCFGPSIFNTPRSGRDATVWTTTFVNDAGKPAHITGDMSFKDAAFEGDRCIAQVWVKKYRASGGNAPPPVTTVASPPPKSSPDVAACISGGEATPDRLATCDKLLGKLRPDEQDYGMLAISLMQMNAEAGNRADALRYGDMVVATKAGADAQMTRCAVRMIVKWDLDAGLGACRSLGAANAGALEAEGQIHLVAGRWQDAWTAFDAAHKAGGAGQALYLRGLAAAGQGRMGDALKDMADGEAAAPGTAQSYSKDGYTLAAVSLGKPLAPPEAFASQAMSAVAAPAPSLAAAPPAPTPPAPAPPAPAPPAPAPPPVAAAPPPASIRFDPDMPLVASPLGAVDIQVCDDDFRKLQADSQTWQGVTDETSLRLGMLQRTLYATRCAGHPQAASFTAAADRIIADVGPGAAAASAAPAQTTPPATDCLEPIPVGDPRNTKAGSIFRNSCAYPVMVAYCNVAPAPGSWAEMFACESRARIGLVSVPANGDAPVVFGRQINHLACRQPALPLASYTQSAGLHGYCK